MRTLLYLLAIAVFVQTAHAQNTGLPTDKLALRYRIELLDGKEWKPVAASKNRVISALVRSQLPPTQ